MLTPQTVSTATLTPSQPSIDWRAIIAGAIAAAAISVLLIGFGSAIGLTLTSARPYAGISGTTLSILIAVWFAAVHVGSFAAGGYVAGRLRNPEVTGASERHFRDGAHGFLVWALGTLVGATLLATTAASVTSKTVDVAGRVTGAVGSLAGQATPPATLELINYNVDRLMRRPSSAPTTPTTTTPVTAAPPTTVPRDPAVVEEAARILAIAIINGTLDPKDRDYLAGVVATRSGVPPPEATARVDEAYKALQQKKAELENMARDAAETARKSAILLAFLTAAVSLAGLVAAAWGASEGGNDRDAERMPAVFGARRLW